MVSTSAGAHYPPGDGLELFIDAVGDYAISMLDPKGFVISWNAGAERIHGFSAVEIIGQHFSRFFTPEDREDHIPEQILAAAKEEGRHEAEGWRARKDGSRFWSNAILQRVVDKQGRLIGFAKVTRDITERVAAHHALVESERRFRLLVEGVIDYAIYMLDPSGIITNWNTGAERLKGYGADEIIGQHFSKFYTKEERAKGKPVHVLDTAAREGRYEGEGWRVRKDGSRFWASVVVDAIRDESGNLQGFAKITRDITERRAAQEAVRESERQFRLLVGSVTDYALFMLDLNGIVSSWNAGAERIKGYTADEIIGHHFSRFYTEHDRTAGLPARTLYIATQEGRFETEGWRVRKDGTLFWANVVIDGVRDEQGDLIGFAKITRDITERRDAQIALQKAQTERAHAQKMDALGQLTSGVAHDFNNLLAVMESYVRIMKKKVAEDHGAQRATECVQVALERGKALTRQLLTFSRKQSLTSEIVSLRSHIDAVCTMLASSIGAEAKIMANTGPETWPVRTDSGELELALMNIMLNARDAMPDGGVITLMTENVALSQGDSAAGLEGDFVALRVSDTGTGMPADVLAKVFEPFFTTKAEKGTGLGLAQVYGFARQSGGAVVIDSELGKGTTVTIYLPRAKEADAASAAHPHLQPARNEMVLLVEDNPGVAEICVKMLEELGYTVHTAYDGEAALAAIGKQKFDLVISDIVMAGAMDGVALAHSIRNSHPNLPVLLMTGYDNKKAEVGKDIPLVNKPVEFGELSRITARLIAQAKQPDGTNVVRLRDRDRN